MKKLDKIRDINDQDRLTQLIEGWMKMLMIFLLFFASIAMIIGIEKVLDSIFR